MRVVGRRFLIMTGFTASKETENDSGIKFACIPTRDQDRALKFYSEKLGFRVMTNEPFGAQRWIELGIPGAESHLVLFTPEGHEDRIGGFQAVTFWTDDVFATAKTMKSKGVEFAVEPKKGAVRDDLDLQGRRREPARALQQVSAGGSARVGTAALGCPAERSSAVRGCSAVKPPQIVGVVGAMGVYTQNPEKIRSTRAADNKC
jgi:catechol 2,3-dioxygenase-like lactoylglutathione lyase family enzyme